MVSKYTSPDTKIKLCNNIEGIKKEICNLKYAGILKYLLVYKDWIHITLCWQQWAKNKNRGILHLSYEEKA